MKTRLTIKDVMISDLVQLQDEKLLKGYLTAKFEETHWMTYVVFRVEPDAKPNYVLSKLNMCMMQLMNYAQFPYDAPSDNPYTGTDESKSWHAELERIGISKPIKSEVKV